MRRLLRRLRGFRARTRTWMVLVAVAAVIFAGLHEYLHPARAWRRAIRSGDDSSRSAAWGEARSGRIEGLGREATLAEVRRAMETGDPGSRASAVVAFAYNEPDPRVAIPGLADRLADPDPLVRRAAARAIKFRIGSGGERRKLARHELAAARSSPDAGLRRAIVDVLGSLAERTTDPADPSLPLLRESLAADPDPGVRIASALALARVGVVGEGAVPLLGDYLRDHSGYDCPKPYCTDALLALANLLRRSDEAATCLIDRATRGDNGARDAETTLAGEANQDDRAHDRVEALLARFARHAADPERQVKAATLLLKIASARRFLALEDSPIRRRAERTVRSAGRLDLRIVGALEAVADDPDPILQARAVETLQALVPGWMP